jgi:hypothetical protein
MVKKFKRPGNGTEAGRQDDSDFIRFSQIYASARCFGLRCTKEQLIALALMIATVPIFFVLHLESAS